MRRTIRSAAFFLARSVQLLLQSEYPDNAALGHVVLHTDVVGGQRILDTLRVNTPARLDRDIFRAIHFIRDGISVPRTPSARHQTNCFLVRSPAVSFELKPASPKALHNRATTLERRVI